MFRVKHKQSGKVYTVAHVSELNGSLMFYAYNGERWIKYYADDFEPFIPFTPVKKILNENVTEVKKCLL